MAIMISGYRLQKAKGLGVGHTPHSRLGGVRERTEKNRSVSGQEGSESIASDKKGVWGKRED